MVTVQGHGVGGRRGLHLLSTVPASALLRQRQRLSISLYIYSITAYCNILKNYVRILFNILHQGSHGHTASYGVKKKAPNSKQANQKTRRHCWLAAARRRGGESLRGGTAPSPGKKRGGSGPCVAACGYRRRGGGARRIYIELTLIDTTKGAYMAYSR